MLILNNSISPFNPNRFIRFGLIAMPELFCELPNDNACCYRYVEGVFCAMLWNLYTTVRCIHYRLMYSLDFISKDKELAEQYARSRQKGQDSRFEDMLDYARESKDDPYTKKLYIDTLKWVLSKQQPKKYGDKLEVDGKNIAPTTIIIKRADE